MEQQRNMILAFVLSMAILAGWQFLFPTPEAPEASQTATAGQAANQEGSSASPGQDHAAPPSPPKGGSQATTPTVAQASAPAGRQPARTLATLENGVLRLTVDARGALIRAVALKYRKELDPSAPFVDILGRDGKQALYVNAGVVGHPLPEFRVVSRKRQGDETVLTLAATLDDGRAWTREIRLKQGAYVLDVRDQVAGKTARMYRQVVSVNPNREKSRMYQYKGPIGLFDDKLKEVSFDDLDEQSPVLYSSRGGWVGIMNRYFIAAVIGDAKRKYQYYFKGATQGGDSTYQAGVLESPVRVGGGSAEFASRVYIGPKSTPVMETLHVGLERSVDYGWFAFIAKPMHDLLLWLHRFIPNYGWCIIVLVILIKALFFIPTKKSYESMAAMRKLQPEMQRLRELYGDDRQRMGQEMMALYKKHKVNPLGGCLPIVIQIPVFFALYKTLLVSIELRHAPFAGWIHDLSAMDPYYILPVLMGASMIVQQQLNPPPPDPMQAKIMKFLPVIFTFMFLFFPSGLVLYWLVNNVLSIAQQWYVMRQMKAI